MKPSPTPCFVLKTSLYFARRSMIRDMSASLKVVRIAAVCCASTRRWAIFWRIPLIRFAASREARRTPDGDRPGCQAARAKFRRRGEAPSRRCATRSSPLVRRAASYDPGSLSMTRRVHAGSRPAIRAGPTGPLAASRPARLPTRLRPQARRSEGCAGPASTGERRRRGSRAWRPQAISVGVDGADDRDRPSAVSPSRDLDLQGPGARGDEDLAGLVRLQLEQGLAAT